MIKVLIADDHPIVRQGIQKTIEANADMRVEAEAVDAQQTLDFAQQQGIGMISMWSVNRDHACPTQTWVSTTCSSNPEQQSDWAYTSVWVGF